MKAGNLNFLESSGPLPSCNGTALPFTFYWVYWMGAEAWTVDHCQIKVFRGFASFETRVPPCYVMLTEDLSWSLVRLIPFEALFYFFQTPHLVVGVDCLPSRHRFHHNHFFTVPDDSDLDLARWQRIPEFILYTILSVGPFCGLPFFLWCKNNAPRFLCC